MLRIGVCLKNITLALEGKHGRDLPLPSAVLGCLEDASVDAGIALDPGRACLLAAAPPEPYTTGILLFIFYIFIIKNSNTD